MRIIFEFWSTLVSSEDKITEGTEMVRRPATGSKFHSVEIRYLSGIPTIRKSFRVVAPTWIRWCRTIWWMGRYSEQRIEDRLRSSWLTFHRKSRLCKQFLYLQFCTFITCRWLAWRANHRSRYVCFGPSGDNYMDVLVWNLEIEVRLMAITTVKYYRQHISPAVT